MLHVLLGEDNFSVRQALEEIKKSAGDPAALLPNTTVLDGARVTPEQLRAACETVPFLADKRLVIVEGLLEHFESKGRVRRKKSPCQTDQAEDCQPFVHSIKDLPPFTELVIIGGAIKPANPLLVEVSSLAKVRRFPLLRRDELIKWVERRVALQSKNGISKKAAYLMVRLVGNDLWTMSNEIDKLVLFTGGRSIEETDVQAVVSHAQEASIFSMVDAIMESRVSVAQELLQELFRRGMESAYILVMLARQVRIIFQVREMRDRGLSRGAIQTKLKLTQDFVFRRAWEQADKYSTSRLREVYHQLLEADIAVKTGKYGAPGLVLDILIAELGRRSAVSI